MCRNIVLISPFENVLMNDITSILLDVCNMFCLLYDSGIPFNISFKPKCSLNLIVKTEMVA